MAEQIGLKLNVDTATIGELRKEFKSLQKEIANTREGTKEYNDALLKLGNVKGALKDVKEGINALDPEAKFQAFAKIGGTIAGGFQAAQGAMALFGAEGKDVEKALLKVQAATAFAQGIQSVSEFGKAFKIFNAILKANPLLLIATAVVGLGVALFALRDKIKIVGDTFAAIGKIFDFVKDKIIAFSDAIGLTNVKQQELAEQTLATTEMVAQAVGDRYDYEIAKANAAGKEVAELELEKTAAVERSLMAQRNALKALVGEQGKATDEQKKKLEELNEAIKKAQQDFIIAEIALETKAEDEREKRGEKKKKDDEDKAKKAEDERKKELDEQNKWNEIYTQTATEQAQFEANRIQNEFNEQNEARNADLANIQATREKNLADEVSFQKNRKDALEQSAAATNESLLTLGNLFIKNQKKLEKFQKAVALNQILVDTAKAISTTISNATQAAAAGGPAAPYLQVAYIASGIATVLANVARAKQILSKSGDTPSVDLGGGGGGGGTFTGGQGVTSPVTPPRNESTLLTPDGKPIEPIKAFVVETDITSSQKKIKSIEGKATFG
jgi:hypothetical protein